MEGAATLITAVVGLLTALGAVGKFVWDKVEARFKAIELELAKCHKREDASRERRAVQLTVIELLWLEVKRHLPDSPALERARKLLEDLKTTLSATEAEKE